MTPGEVFKIVTKVGPVIGSIIKEPIDSYMAKDHGSKVKQGAFKECSIEMFGNKACIVVNPKSGEIVVLSSDNISSYEYVKEKEKFKPTKLKTCTYYYYNITFKDGRESYVRMRKKYVNAMKAYT